MWSVTVVTNSKNTAALQGKANFTSSLPLVQGNTATSPFPLRTPNPLSLLYPKHKFTQRLYKVMHRCQNYEDLFMLHHCPYVQAAGRTQPYETWLKQNKKLITLLLDSTFQSFWHYLQSEKRRIKMMEFTCLEVELSSRLWEWYPDFKLRACFIRLWPEMRYNSQIRGREGFP